MTLHYDLVKALKDLREYPPLRPELKNLLNNIIHVIVEVPNNDHQRVFEYGFELYKRFKKEIDLEPNHPSMQAFKNLCNACLEKFYLELLEQNQLHQNSFRDIKKL